jgi:hypothetical protein
VNNDRGAWHCRIAITNNFIFDHEFRWWLTFRN